MKWWVVDGEKREPKAQSHLKTLGVACHATLVVCTKYLDIIVAQESIPYS